jgi:hypothetical protein
MRHLGIADLLVVLGVTGLLWLGRYLLPDMQSPVSAQHTDSLGRGARHMWNLPRRPLFWVLVGFLALLAVTWALQPTPK